MSKSKFEAGTGHISALTSMRFVAAFAVVAFHFGGPAVIASNSMPTILKNIFFNTYLGVSFFFLLSGFVLAYVYHDRLSNFAGLRSYAVARFARIYPVYVLAVLSMYPFTPSVDPSSSWAQFFLIQCWTPLTERNNWQANWNLQAWTLSLEWFFYILFPLLLLLLRNRSLQALTTLISVIICVLFLLRSSGISSGDTVLYSWELNVPLPVLRLPEFALGILLGVLHVRGAIRPSQNVLRIAIFILLYMIASSDSRWVAPFATVLFAVIIAFVPTTLKAGQAGLLGRVLSHPTLILLGEASYALYLLASPTNLFLRGVFGTAWMSIGRFVFIPIVILISILCLYLLEAPTRRLIRRRFDSNGSIKPSYQNTEFLAGTH